MNNSTSGRKNLVRGEVRSTIDAFVNRMQEAHWRSKEIAFWAFIILKGAIESRIVHFEAEYAQKIYGRGTGA